MIYHHAQLGMGEFSQVPEPLAQLVPQKVKVENYLYILLSAARAYVQQAPANSTPTVGPLAELIKYP